MGDTLLQYELPNGHRIVTNKEYRRGGVVAPFGCRLCHIHEKGETFEYAIFGGIVSRQEVVDWIHGAIKKTSKSML